MYNKSSNLTFFFYKLVLIRKLDYSYQIIESSSVLEILNNSDDLEVVGNLIERFRNIDTFIYTYNRS